MLEPSVSFLKICLFLSHVFWCVYHMLVEVRKGHWELQMVVSCRVGAGDRSWSAGRTATAFNPRALSPAPDVVFIHLVCHL